MGQRRRTPPERVKVAYFSPLPPERTGIADYSALLLPELQRRVEVDVVRRGRRRAPRGTDVCLYHVGNNPDAHGWIVAALKRRRGVVVLHDFVLHHLVAGLTVGRGDSDGYLDAMQRDSGVFGRLVAHGVIDGLLPPVWETRADQFPLVHEVLDHADGVIVHSRFVEDRVREVGFRGPVWRIPMPAWPEPVEARPFALPRPASVVIGCFGNLNPAKARAAAAAGVRSSSRKKHEDALLVLAGGISSRYDLELQAEEHGLEPGRLRHPSRLSRQRETSSLSSLRATSWSASAGRRWGRPAASVIRALTAGRPIVVSDVGWFSELPDRVAAKVPVGPEEVETLNRLSSMRSPRTKCSGGRWDAQPAEYAREEHDLDRAADLYVAALEEGAGGLAVRDEVAGRARP